jgi:hypothetical protein
MFGLFESPPFVDPALGGFTRKRGVWRGTITLDGRAVPLVLAGGKSSPDAAALELARALAADYPTWRDALAAALFEHYEPYAELGGDDPDFSTVAIDSASAVWPHATLQYVLVAPFEGELTFELGYEVAWDEEHTLGARLRDGVVVELNGSVVMP